MTTKTVDAQTIGMIIDSIPQNIESSRSRLATIADMVRNKQSRRKPTIYGAHVAYRNFTHAMLSELSFTQFCLFCSPTSYDAVRQFHGSLDAELRERILVVNHRDIASTVSKTDWLGWIDDSGQMSVPFDIRSNHAAAIYPIAVSHHTLSYPEQLHGTYMSLILSPTYECDSFVCTSTAAKRMVENTLQRTADALSQSGGKNRFNGRLDLIPLGVDCQKFYPRSKERCRDRFGIPHRDVVILYLGRLSAIDKGDLFPLVLAFQEVRRRNPSTRVKLVIAGQSFYGYGQVLFKSLRLAGISQNVVFLPRVREEEKTFLYGAADVFVSPSDNLQECFGQTVVEAMASGVPQVVSDWDGYRDTVVHGKSGFLVPTLWGRCDDDLQTPSQMFPGTWQVSHYMMAQATSVDPHAMASYLERLILDPGLRAMLATFSRERAESIFDWKVVANQYRSLLADLKEVAPKGPPPRRLCYKKPMFFESASHFPSRLLSEQTVVVRGGFGISIGGQPFLPYNKGMPDCGEQSLWNLRGILEEVTCPTSIADLRRACAATVKCSPDVFTRQLLWLVKYSFLLVIDEA